jgi:hypothetical protein
MNTPAQPGPPDPQRGADPPNAIGTEPATAPPPDPKFQPDPALLRSLIEDYDSKADRGRPNREDVLPYLLVRAFTPGDRGARPTWPPTPSWESPDLLLIDASYTGPFDPSQCVAMPISGRTYRVFVRVFNLGMLPAVGTQVTAYLDLPHFVGQSGYKPRLIGAAYAEFADRTHAESVQVVEVQPSWTAWGGTFLPQQGLVATVSCLADPWRGEFDANNDRHVGARSVTVSIGHANLARPIGQLAGQIPAGGALEIIHGGPAVVPLLTAISGGKLPSMASSTDQPIVAPDLGDIRHGVLTNGQFHLMTAIRRESDFVAVPTEIVTSAMTRRAPATATTILRDASPNFLDTNAISGTSKEAPAILPEAIARMLDIGNLEAGSIAAALGGPPNSAHLLRFIASDSSGALIGGHSIVVAQG